MTAFKNFIAKLRTPKGRDILMFLIFVCISAILWLVLAINEEEQFNIRIPVKISHVPDSVTLLTPGNAIINASINTKGINLLKSTFGKATAIDIDFRKYQSNNNLIVSNPELKGLVKSSSGCLQVNRVYPDSISILYTSHPGHHLPIHIDYRISTDPQSTLVGQPKASIDSAYIFVIGENLPESYDYINTEPIHLTNLNSSITRRVKLSGPVGSRIIPDSIDVQIKVEPLIIKRRKVVIEPVNVPENIKLITFPAQVDVTYMIPMKSSTTSEPRFRVVADFSSIDFNSSSKKVRLQPIDVPNNLQNVHLLTDSAEYIIEHL